MSQGTLHVWRPLLSPQAVMIDAYARQHRRMMSENRDQGVHNTSKTLLIKGDSRIHVA